MIELDLKMLHDLKELINYDSRIPSIFVIELKNILECLKKASASIGVEGIERRRLLKLLSTAGIEAKGDKDVIEIYEDALSVSKSGYRILHKRDIDECYINNYNAEWIISWNSNMDLQVCLDYYGIITYISNYFSKDDTGTVQYIIEALKQALNQSLQNRLSVVANIFLTHRQIGESEAFYKILPHLQMKYSNIDCVFLPTGFKKNRSSFLMQLTVDEAKHCADVIQVENKEGLFTEKPSMIDKFERMDRSINKGLQNLTYIQFAMKYVSCNAKCVRESDFESIPLTEADEGWHLNDEMDLIVTHDFNVLTVRHTLPKYIKLLQIKPGEPKYMRKRSRQVIRMHKVNFTKNPHEFYYSELQLYCPFGKESDLYPDDLEKCKDLYEKRSVHNNYTKVANVKSILMENLESVEMGTEKAQESLNSEIGAAMDPEHEQDQDDCEYEGYTEHSDFVFKDPTDLEQSELQKQAFRSIDLYETEQLETLTSCLDEDQRYVLDIGVNFAKAVAKRRENGGPIVMPELVAVQGGAGTGKSMVIDVLSQHMERIFRSSGDNPDHPYIIKAAFTGTAAANIKGQTLHSAFSFSFGNEFFSLSDKKREERRNQLENLIVVIIDEFSFIKADMLYLLDLRLKEIKQVNDIPFGGVSIFFFGDILQLRPVCAAFIFEEPVNEKFKLAYLAGSLWQRFKIVLLRKNHRQGEDRYYADLLNRLRKDEMTESDIKALETRVRKANNPEIPKDALVVTCINKEVNRINDERLEAIDHVEYSFESINQTSTKKVFQPKVDSSGSVSGTPLQKVLRLKMGAKVMLTYNLDTCDCLTNGAFGEVVGFAFNGQGRLTEVHVQFDNPDCGQKTRKMYSSLNEEYPGKNVIPIKPIEFNYSLSKKTSGGQSNATVIQIPLKLAFASTAHKVQGLTVKKPSSLVADLRSVREPAQAYVILSRVQALSQLFILESLNEEKISSSVAALAELKRMEEVSVNANLLCSKESLILSCNIRSFRKNFDHLVSRPEFKKANLVCLQETWLEPSILNDTTFRDWTQHNNSVGRGKGITTLFKSPFSWVADVTKPLYQLTRLNVLDMNVVNVYRSDNANTKDFLKDLINIMDGKQSVVIGDFNLCFLSENNHPIFKFFKECGFSQMVQYPTHIKGRMIDLVFVDDDIFQEDVKFMLTQQSPFFTDHDLISISSGE